MTDLDVLEKLKSIVGGNLSNAHVYTGKYAHYKPIWRWYEGKRKDVIRLLNAILPYMSERRTKRIKELLEFDQKYPHGRERANAAQHGSIGMYTNQKCRCEICVTVYKKYKRQYEAKRAARPIENATHGTLTGYKYYHCRCNDCKEAMNKNARDYRARKKQEKENG